MDDFYANLGKKVKELRIQNGLTQNEVATALNVTPGYISNVENNRSAMTLRLLMYYAELTHVSLDSLIGSIDSDYEATAIDYELHDLTRRMTDEAKKNLVSTLKIWVRQ
jgi:transcriptional regulator with XRE-family HTH domain